ncbi:MAG: S9 family peptidase [Gemmatimonadetes bacterium]|nr:S9 family peptidase [Gemmatimonadota bacterium]MSR35064.1 S9 family peptidase [Gemmatimonadota bacterium]
MRAQLGFALTIALVGASTLTAQQRISSVEESLGVSGQLSGRAGPASLNWIDQGRRFSYTAVDPQSRRPQVRGYDPATRRDEILFDPSTLQVPGTARPLAYESFDWSSDSRHIVFQADFRPIYRYSGIADFYIYGVEDRTLVLAADDARTAELSPNGSLFAYERGGDLFVYDTDAERERRLTTTGSETVWNGVFDWVYEEEFGLTQGWDWSPDGSRIAYWQTHVANTPTIQITDWEGQYPRWTVMPYPKVGQPNSDVRIGVVDVASGETRWMDVGIADEHYVPRIYWTSDPNTLAVVTLNRLQNHMQLFFFDVRSGERRLVMEERSEAWIDVFDFFANILHYFYFPEGVREFFWIDDQDGYNHLYRYSYDGELLNQVTAGEWVVTRVEGIDPESRTIYYTGTEESPLERHLYAVGFDGRGKRRLTPEAGNHSIDLSPSAEYYVDTWSSASRPRQAELWSTEGNGSRIATLEANAQVQEFVRARAYSPTELFSFTTTDGVELDGSMVRPPNFDPSQRHPVVISIYGGPGSQQVYNEWANDGWSQYLAQQGYIVVGLNNRGSGNYGRDFMEIVYGELGRWEANDFAELARWLATQPGVDGERMAILGTSYGGYMAITTLLRHPGVFRLGIANSPLADWRLYDTIYSERYLGLLPEGDPGYEASSVLAKVDALEDQLLLIHSGMDENVHPQNTMQLLTALASAGKDAELRFFPPGAHGAAFDFASYVTMHEVYTNALCEHVAASCTPANLNR